MTTEQSGNARRFVSGSAQGAFVGSQFGGWWGAAIGAAVGGFIGLLASRPEPVGTAVEEVRNQIRSVVTAARWVVGRSLVGGVVAYGKVADAANPEDPASPYRNANLHLAVAVSEGAVDGIERVRMDGEWITVEAIGNRLVPTDPIYRKHVHLIPYLAADGNQGETLWRASDNEWSPAHRLQGISWVHIIIQQGRNRENEDGTFVEGVRYGPKFTRVPEFEFLVRGQRITWPGQAVPVWTESAAALRRWFLAEVIEDPIPDDRLDEPSFRRAEAVASETLRWNAREGYAAEGKRYTCNGVIRSTDDVAAIEEAMDWCMQGSVPEVAGRRVFVAGAMDAPAFTLTDADILEMTAARIAPPLGARVNRLRCSIPQSAEHDCEPLHLDHEDAALRRRDGIALAQSIGPRPFTTHPYEAGRLLAVAVRRYAGRVFTLALRPSLGLMRALSAGTVGTVSSEIHRIPPMLAVVDGKRVRPDWTLLVTLREVSAEMFADTVVHPPPKTRAEGHEVLGSRFFGGPRRFDGARHKVYQWEHGFAGFMLVPDTGTVGTTPAAQWDGREPGGAAAWPFGDADPDARYTTAEVAVREGWFSVVRVTPTWAEPPGLAAGDRVTRQESVVQVEVFDGATWGHFATGLPGDWIEVPTGTRARATVPWAATAESRSRNVALTGVEVTLARTAAPAGGSGPDDGYRDDIEERDPVN